MSDKHAPEDRRLEPGGVVTLRTSDGSAGGWLWRPGHVSLFRRGVIACRRCRWCSARMTLVMVDVDTDDDGGDRGLICTGCDRA